MASHLLSRPYLYPAMMTYQIGHIFGRPYSVERHVDAKPIIENNPLRYVNSPVGKEENSIINIRHQQKGSARNGCVHYYTTRKITKGEELFVDYGENYRTWMETKLK